MVARWFLDRCVTSEWLSTAYVKGNVLAKIHHVMFGQNPKRLAEKENPATHSNFY